MEDESLAIRAMRTDGPDVASNSAAAGHGSNVAGARCTSANSSKRKWFARGQCVKADAAVELAYCNAHVGSAPASPDAEKRVEGTSIILRGMNRHVGSIRRRR
jgi:hypothetical protein